MIADFNATFPKSIKGFRFPLSRPIAGEIMGHHLGLDLGKDTGLWKWFPHLERNGRHIADGVDIFEPCFEGLAIYGNPACFANKARLHDNLWRTVRMNEKKKIIVSRGSIG